MIQKRPTTGAESADRAALDKYKLALFIDKHNLDEELMRNPQLYMEVSERYATAQSVRDEAKSAIDEAKSSAGETIRQEAESGAYKLSEDRVKAMVVGHATVVAANKAYIQANKSAEDWRGAQEAFKMRGYALSTLAGLFTANYFVRDSVKAGPAGGIAYDQGRQTLSEARRRLNPGAQGGTS